MGTKNLVQTAFTPFAPKACSWKPCTLKDVWQILKCPLKEVICLHVTWTLLDQIKCNKCNKAVITALQITRLMAQVNFQKHPPRGVTCHGKRTGCCSAGCKGQIISRWHIICYQLWGCKPNDITDINWNINKSHASSHVGTCWSTYTRVIIVLNIQKLPLNATLCNLF